MSIDDNALWYTEGNGGIFLRASKEQGVKPLFIEPGSPWQNGYVESFNGKLRDECLNEETYWTRAEAQVLVDWWREVYNHERPHSSLGMKTPAEVSMESETGRRTRH